MIMTDEREKYIKELKQLKDQVVRDVKDYEYLFKSVMYYTPIPFWIKSLDGDYLFVNREWERQFNMTLENVRYMKDEQVWVAKEISHEFRRNDLEVINSKKSLMTKEDVPDPVTKEAVAWMVIKFPIFENEDKQDVVRVGGFAIRLDKLKSKVCPGNDE